MTSFGRKLAGFALAGSLALAGLAGLAGCGAQGAAAPTTTKEVLERYDANANKGNYHVDMDMGISMSVFGMDIDLPIKGAFDAIDTKTHGTMSVDMTSLGATSLDMEVYSTKEGDKTIQYMAEASNPTDWVSATTDSAYFTTQLTSSDLLSEATFATVDGGYQLSIPASKLFDAISSALGEQGGESMLDSLVDPEAQKALADLMAVFTFDQDCLLKTINMDFSYDYSYPDGSSNSSSSTSTSSASSMSLKMTIDCAFGGYGTIKEDAVTVPDEVKRNAVDASSLTDTLDSAVLSEEAAAEIADAEAAAEAADAGSAAETTGADSAAEATSVADAA